MESNIDPLPTLVVVLATLLSCWIGLRRLDRVGASRVGADWSRVHGGRTTWMLVGALTLLASAPIVLGLPEFLTSETMLPGDAPSHAVVAQRIVRDGLPHGWIDAYNGGFPFGPHYQSAAILVVAALVRAGIQATPAVHAVGIGSILAAPLLFVALARAAGARPLAALLGAILLSWAAPFQTFVGGPRVYLSQGLLSQAFATPFLVATAYAVLIGRPRGGAAPLGALAMAAHAQVTLCAFAVGALAVAMIDSRAVRRRFVSAGVGAAVLGLAVYGPGARVLAVPFSWARVAPYAILGWGPERLPGWLLGGELLDNGRAPVLTSAMLAAALVLLATLRSRASRASLAFLGASLALSVSGGAFLSLGRLGGALVEVLSPVRMLCVVPFAAATAVCVALSELRPRIVAATPRGGPLACGAAEVAVLGAFVCFAGVGSLDWQRRRVALEASLREPECKTAGYRTADVAGWLADLRGGRLVTDAASFPTQCPARRGLELASPAPLGAGLGGPGSQVGVLQLAFDRIATSKPNGAARAEALGVRYVLHTRQHRPLPAESWRVRASERDVELSERVPGTGAIGTGCVTAVWRGPDRALRDALFESLEGERSLTDEPRTLIALEAGPDAVVRGEVPRGACNAEDARVEERPREPGAYEATISSSSELDVVIRATYLPTWTILLDGVPAALRKVAPGYPSIRVPAGEHRIEAVVHLLPHYLEGVFASVIGVALLALAERRRSRRA